MLEYFTTFGYVMGAIGFAGCVAAYFLLPKLLQSLMKDDES